jgi:hypothetical protein
MGSGCGLAELRRRQWRLGSLGCHDSRGQLPVEDGKLRKVGEVAVGRAPTWQLSSEVRQWMSSHRAAVRRPAQLQNTGRRCAWWLQAEAENGRGREWGPSSACGRERWGGWQPARRAVSGGRRCRAGARRGVQRGRNMGGGEATDRWGPVTVLAV